MKEDFWKGDDEHSESNPKGGVGHYSHDNPNNPKTFWASMPNLQEFKGFLIKKNPKARVNVIGYSKNGVVSEEEIFLTSTDINQNFSLDKKGKVYRIEFYEGKNFCGMINAKKVN